MEFRGELIYKRRFSRQIITAVKKPEPGSGKSRKKIDESKTIRLSNNTATTTKEASTKLASRKIISNNVFRIGEKSYLRAKNRTRAKPGDDEYDRATDCAH